MEILNLNETNYREKINNNLKKIDIFLNNYNTNKLIFNNIKDTLISANMLNISDKLLTSTRNNSIFISKQNTIVNSSNATIVGNKLENTIASNTVNLGHSLNQDTNFSTLISIGNNITSRNKISVGHDIDNTDYNATNIRLGSGLNQNNLRNNFIIGNTKNNITNKLQDASLFNIENFKYFYLRSLKQTLTKPNGTKLSLNFNLDIDNNEIMFLEGLFTIINNTIKRFDNYKLLITKINNEIIIKKFEIVKNPISSSVFDNGVYSFEVENGILKLYLTMTYTTSNVYFTNKGEGYIC